MSLTGAGYVRTWLGSHYYIDPADPPPTAEFQVSSVRCIYSLRYASNDQNPQILREVQYLFPVLGSRRQEGPLYVHHIPFRFVIPHRLISTHSNIRPEFLKLCPTALIGLLYRPPSSRQLYGQPSVTYTLGVDRIKTITRRSTRFPLEREIVVRTSSPPEPPLGLEFYPLGEYQPCVIKKARKHGWTLPFGVLEATAVEPPPLNTLTLAPRPATSVSIELVFKPRPARQVTPSPLSWECTVTYQILCRTFHSTKVLEHAPTRSTTKRDDCLAMRDKKIASEIRKHGVVCWTSNPNHPVPGLGPWVATLIVPVTAPKSLPSTFLNPLSSRQYLLEIRLHIKPLCHGTLVLVLPLQVIHYSGEARRGQVQVENENRENLSLASLELSRLMELAPDQHTSPPPYEYV